MANTPFLSSLSPAQKARVAKYARKERPSYFDPTLAAIQEDTKRTGEDPNEFNPNVQISEDLEAALILLSSSLKEAMVKTLADLTKSTSEEDLALMAEVVSARIEGYSTTAAELADPSLSYGRTREAIINALIQAVPRDNDTEKATAILIPDLSNMFQVVSASLADFTKTEVMAVHDRITDAMTLNAYSSAGATRLKELSSWKKVITTYNTTS